MENYLEEIKNETVDDVTPTKPLGVANIGKYQKMNIRKTADFKAEIVGTLKKGDVVEIDTKSSTEEYYAVSTINGIHGFCVKSYISYV